MPNIRLDALSNMFQASVLETFLNVTSLIPADTSVAAPR
jgi:hypothetical protein